MSLVQTQLHPVDALASYYSSYYRLRKAVSWLLRFQNYLKSKEVLKGPVTCEELKIAGECILKHVQQVTYPRELGALKKGDYVSNTSPLNKLSPVLKNDHIVVGGRLKYAAINVDSMHQIILPNDHRVSYLIALHEHNRAHCGVEWVLSKLRERYWIIKIRSLLKKIRFSCIKCKKLHAKPMQQQMADLPSERCKPHSYPFETCGIDVFGHYYVKQGRARVKRYGVIFSCFSSRAVHIEKLNDLTTSSLINALVRFAARRGPIRHIYSDQGTNMVGASNELARSLKKLNKNVIIQEARRLDIDWKFNPPLASHMSGATERMIRIIRRVFHAILSTNDVLTDEILSTILCECENIVNSRPLSKCSDDPLDDQAITPNHLLLMQCKEIIPFHGQEPNAVIYIRKCGAVLNLLLVNFGENG